MSTNSNPLSFEDQQFLEFLREEINFNYSELQSSALAPEDRAEYEEGLRTALLALAACE